MLKFLIEIFVSSTNSQILVVVFVSKLNFSFSFVDENCRIFVVVVVFVTKINLFRQWKFSFTSSSTKKHWYIHTVNKHYIRLSRSDIVHTKQLLHMYNL